MVLIPMMKIPQKILQIEVVVFSFFEMLFLKILTITLETIHQ